MRVPDLFTRLDRGTYLHARPESHVFQLLIDSFRMRQADDFNLEGKIVPGSLYAGGSSSIQSFRDYLAKAGSRPTLLPSWWSERHVQDCLAYGESGAWTDLRKTTTKQDIIQHYGNEMMPMQLRMLAEAIYGFGIMGQDGSGIRKMLMQQENGSSSHHMSLLNLAH